jgi:hypothetical protein
MSISPSPAALIEFDRHVSDDLESALERGGSLRPLVDLGLADPRVDVQLRRRGSTSWASFYCGLTSILDVVERGGKLVFKAHPTHQAAGAFDAEWSSAASIDGAQERISMVASYLTRLLLPGGVSQRYTDGEGALQTAIARVVSSEFGVFQREVVPSFPSEAIRDQLVDPLMERMWSAIESHPEQDKWWPGVRDRGAKPRSGLEIDLLGIDRMGRLLVIEAKPSDELKGLAWAPGQVRLYSEVMAMWLENDPAAPDHINEMVDQRARIGLSTASHHVPTNGSIRIVPVVAVGPTQPSSIAMDRMREVHKALSTVPPQSSQIDLLEIWRHDALGQRRSVTVPDPSRV